jgi:NAD(P)-dependent dehydrogenase (short-subunit alcohol dehydrogenase family)
MRDGLHRQSGPHSLAEELLDLAIEFTFPASDPLSVGAIVNTASIAGVIADPGMAPYVAAKHGVIGLTKAAAIDYAKRGIRVNALAPGLVHSPMTQRWLDDPAMRDVVLAGPLMGRAAKPEEMAGMVLFLCSPLASYATGQTFIVDAGQTAH